jgi:hypothetical protein
MFCHQIAWINLAVNLYQWYPVSHLLLLDPQQVDLGMPNFPQSFTLDNTLRR